MKGKAGQAKCSVDTESNCFPLILLSALPRFPAEYIDLWTGQEGNFNGSSSVLGPMVTTVLRLTVMGTEAEMFLIRDRLLQKSIL
jgi:hypothetical protein